MNAAILTIGVVSSDPPPPHPLLQVSQTQAADVGLDGANLSRQVIIVAKLGKSSRVESRYVALGLSL